MRIREPKTTALIFASGKMVVTGAKLEDGLRLASRKYARIVQKLGFDAKFYELKIQNIVGLRRQVPHLVGGTCIQPRTVQQLRPRGETLSLFARSMADLLAAFPQCHLRHDQAQGCAAYLSTEEDHPDECQGQYPLFLLFFTDTAPPLRAFGNVRLAAIIVDRGVQQFACGSSNQWEHIC
ncbi:hypothetical protein NMY22_g9927 [Coprinellus aureogranulatus]|nr:hypothetical protein NMY22_g9927 [Coprinellus aureogranulatus]